MATRGHVNSPPLRSSPAPRRLISPGMAALLARERRARGVKLNHPEAIALITAAILEGARDGRSVATLMAEGATVLKRSEVMEGVAEMIDEIQVEATFPA